MERENQEKFLSDLNCKKSAGLSLRQHSSCREDDYALFDKIKTEGISDGRTSYIGGQSFFVDIERETHSCLESGNFLDGCFYVVKEYSWL